MFFLIVLLFTPYVCAIEQWTPDFYNSEDYGHGPEVHVLREIPYLRLCGNEGILDAGCGDGARTKLIADTYLCNGTIHGIDNSNAMIEVANIEYASSNITFEQADIFTYQPVALYDVVLCLRTLYLFDDYQVGLRRLLSFLKPGGKLLVFHIIHPGTPFFQLFKQIVNDETKMPFVLPSLSTIVDALEYVSATIERLEVKINYDRYADVDSFIQGMKHIPFFNSFLMEHDVRDQIIASYFQQSDGTFYDYSLVISMVLVKQ